MDCPSPVYDQLLVDRHVSTNLKDLHVCATSVITISLLGVTLQ